jgi:hypothetical protein
MRKKKGFDAAAEQQAVDRGEAARSDPGGKFRYEAAMDLVFLAYWM